MICVFLKNWIFREIFIEILEFLYSGKVRILEEGEFDRIKEFLVVVEKLKVFLLVDICNYLFKFKGDEKKIDIKKKIFD